MLDYAFFPNFAGADTLLFAGNNRDLDGLMSLFDVVMAQEVGTLKLSEELGFRARNRTLAHVSIVEGSNVSRVEVKAGSVAIVKWELSVDAAATGRQLIVELIKHDRPSHQFLECSGEIQIIASLNEYNQAVFED